ncbi:MAG: flagellar biosynthesis anti-sigma factor FlgM [Betaproteobacteria bacterium]|nr:flagellar biosynthesis anti-sigma factor FlgM [Betaproteobacteria bacterium]
MKIDTTLKSAATSAIKGARSVKGSAATSSRSAGAVSDSVDLTTQAALMQQLESELSSLDVSNPAKVESIRNAIADGSFHVDEEAVAEGMIQETVENLSHQLRR